MSFGIELKSTILSAVGELKDGRPVNGLKNLVRYPSAFDGNAVRSVQGTATRGVNSKIQVCKGPAPHLCYREWALVSSAWESIDRE
ncbi:hypothetical protein FOBRF1_000318 [Fusarium oxysporum]